MDASGDSVGCFTPTPATTTYAPASVSVTTGTYGSGNLASISTFNDANAYSVTEVTGVPGFDVRIGFTGVTVFNRVELNLAYTNASQHVVDVDLYNNGTAAWDTVGVFQGLAGYTQFQLGVIDSTPYVSAGAVQLRLYHVTTGSGAHSIQIDYATLQQATQGPQGPQGDTGPTGPAGTTDYNDLSNKPTIPTDISASEFVTFAANANLSAERVLTAGTNTSVDTGTVGQVKINVSGLEPAGNFSGIGTCTNTFARVLNDTAAPSCAGVGVADFTANQGTTTQVLHGNAAGQPSWGTVAVADLPTVTVAKGGTGLTTIAADNLWRATATDTVSATAIPSCSNATTSKLLYDTTAHTFSCGTDQTSAGGASVAGTKTMLTATWASSGTINVLGIVGTGTVPLTSPTYAGAAPFSFRCLVATARPATTNGPRYGIQTSGSVTRISYRAEVGLAAATQTITKGLALATATCAAGCTTAMTTGTVVQVMEDLIEGSGVMNATGTLSLVMAPSAGAANTAQIGSTCIWY